MKDRWRNTPLGQLEDVEELKRRYRIFSSEVLLRWMEVVTGPHREAMEAILQKRGSRKG